MLASSDVSIAARSATFRAKRSRMSQQASSEPLLFTMDPSQSPSAASGTSTDRFEAEAERIPDEILEAGSPAQPSKGAGQPEAVIGWPEAMVRGVFELPTAFLAGRLGEYWKLTEAERSMLVLAAKPVLDEYLPFDTFGKLGALLAVATVVFGPRLAQWQIERNAPAIQSTQTAASAA